MVELRVETSEGIALRHEIAGAGSRAAAALVDGFLLALFFLALLLVFLLLGELVLVLAASFLLMLVAYQVGFGILRGRTPGGALLGLRVIDRDGVPARAVQHLLRGLFVPLETLLLVPVPLGLIVMATTPLRQRLGDLVAGTVVVREASRRGLEEPRVRAPARPSLGLVPAHSARFAAADLELLRELLARTEVDPAARRRLFVRSARHYLRVLGLERADEPTPEEASEILRELYAFLRDRGAKGALG
jgi:uncharacterized RDD family membrane protein YckC